MRWIEANQHRPRCWVGGVVVRDGRAEAGSVSKLSKFPGKTVHVAPRGLQES